MKKIVALLLAAVMLCSLSACGSNTEKMEALSGRWEMVTYLDAATAKSALELLEFYPEEIALLDLNSMGLVMIAEFNMNGTYRFAFDLEGSLDMVRGYYKDAMTKIYDSRDQLVEIYGEGILEMTQADFEQYYAELFSMESFDALLQYFLETSLDYEYLEQDIEVGTFRIAKDNIVCTVEGEDTPESMGYSIEGNTLTLTYVNGTEVYTKAN